MSIKAVIFDWGGTLTPWHDIDLRTEWLGYATAWGATDPQAMADRILAAADDAWRRAREVHSSAHVDDILRAAGLDPAHPRHPAAYEEYLRFWDEHTYTDPQVRPLWESLRDKGLRIGVLSNTIWPASDHRWIFERDGVVDLIDGAVYSSEIPWTKPHPEAFRAAAASLGVEPTDCVYVGDRLYEDVHGPQQVGMRTIWIPHSTIPAFQHVETGAEPHASAQELSDVGTIVTDWLDRPDSETHPTA